MIRQQVFYKMIAIHLSEKEALNTDTKAMQQIYFTRNLERGGNTTMFFIIEEAKETILDFSQGTVIVLATLFCFNIISI